MCQHDLLMLLKEISGGSVSRCVSVPFADALCRQQGQVQAGGPGRERDALGGT